MGRRDLHSLLQNITEENRLLGDTLKRTNVVLSLNKKQRWRIPLMMNQTISKGSFDHNTRVSFLERHKLKRSSNCTGFSCNMGRLTSIQPKQKKYFSFSYDSFDKELSNREVKRLKVKELRTHTKVKERVLKRYCSLIKCYDTYTYDGKGPSQPVVQKWKNEYRLEAFHPCPQNCSLTFNPKYTDVRIEENIHGKQKVRANVKSPRGDRRRHRKRFTTKDIDSILDQSIDQDVHQMLDDCFDKETDTEEIVENGHENNDTDDQPRKSFLEILIERAEKAYKVPVIRKQQHKRKNSGQQKSNVKRRHIVQMEKEKGESDALNTQSLDSCHYLQVKPLDYVKVVLKSDETKTEYLQEKYGTLYSEADCQPRRFVIDISDDVENLLSRTKRSPQSFSFKSYLVFNYDRKDDGDDDLEVFRVILNSYVCKNRANLSEHIGFSQICVDDVINCAMECLLALRDKKELKTIEFYNNYTVEEIHKFIYKCLGLKVKTFKPLNTVSVKNACRMYGHITFAPTKQSETNTCCDICYDIRDSTKVDAVLWTQLKMCGHLYCANCLACHVQSQIRNGVTTISCPGHNCTTEIGSATLLSIVDVCDVALLFQRQAEKEAEEAENTKWCPNALCGRVIQIDSDTDDLCQDIACSCGIKICFVCLCPAHWPAKCDQAQEYLEKLNELKPPKEIVAEEDVKVSKDRTRNVNASYDILGYVCPHCSVFFTVFFAMNSRCQYFCRYNSITCRCGYRIRYVCIRRHERILRIFHKRRRIVSAEPSVAPGKPNVDNAKQKATLYQRALQQRLDVSKSPLACNMKDLVKKIVSAARHDMQFKQQILKTVEVQAVPKTPHELETLNIKPYAFHLIKSSQEIKVQLHHVAEFSYVLLQDSPHSPKKQRILRLISDVTGICSFIASILELGGRQNATTAVHRLVSTQQWAKRTLDALIAETRLLRQV